MRLSINYLISSRKVPGLVWFESFYSTLLKRYSLSYENENLDYFISILDSSYFAGEWSIPENIDEEIEDSAEEIEDKKSEKDTEEINNEIISETSNSEKEEGDSSSKD